MTVTVDRFVEKVEQINGEDPQYQVGHDGSDGKCDCVGLLIGALRRCGIKYSGMHGSNWFARKEITDGIPIKIVSAAVLEKGMAVFKSTDDQRNLPDRYKPGGKYYNGDLKDYYHIGVVTSVNPLQITHCTTGRDGDDVPIDTKIGKWQWGGHIKGVNYGESGQQEEESTMRKWIVTANGSVNMRKAPRTSAALIARIPNGTVVEGEPYDENWLRVTYRGETGYSMADFWEEYGAVDDDTPEDEQPPIDENDLPARISALEKRVRNLELRAGIGGAG